MMMILAHVLCREKLTAEDFFLFLGLRDPPEVAREKPWLSLPAYNCDEESFRL